MASTNELKNFHDEVIEFMKTGGGGETFTLKSATTSTLGGVMIGDGLSVDTSGKVSLQTASATKKGGIKVGNGLEMQGDTLNCIISSGTLTEATPTTKGLMSAADKAKLDGLENYTLKAATTSTLGGVKIGDGISVSGGTISLKTASKTQKGAVKVGTGLAISGDTLYVASGVILSSVPSNIEGEMWYEI